MLTKKEVCDLIKLPVSTLSLWVRQGIVKPAKMGTGIGRGNGHYFSLKQTFILAMIACLRDDSPGHYVGPLLVGRIMEEAEQMPDEDFVSCLMVVPDAWDQETTAKALCEAAGRGVAKDLPAQWEPRMIRVLSELQRRVGSRGGVDRIDERRTAEATKAR